MIDWTEILDGDNWEFFARDFLIELGFSIEVEPGRGPDAGRDLIVTEQLRGKLRSKKFRWLVSCKHNAASGAAVGPSIEDNIIDRLTQHEAEGFIGFYSTMASASLIQRLHDLDKSGKLLAYEIFDHKKIEGWFLRTGLSTLALRYFPTSYSQLRPIQKFTDGLSELECEICGTDLLQKSVIEPFSGNLIWAIQKNNYRKYESVHIACKGKCDEELTDRLFNQGYTTNWEDIGDLCNPVLYLKNFLSYTNMLHQKDYEFSEEAHKRMKEVFILVAQRTLREVTEEDKKRFKNLASIDGL